MDQKFDLFKENLFQLKFYSKYSVETKLDFSELSSSSNISLLYDVSFEAKKQLKKNKSIINT